VTVALRYHRDTNHAPDSERLYGHVLDFNNMPGPYKIYRDVPQISLQPTLSRLLLNSNGISRTVRRRGREWIFRAAACTGALYEIELYVVCGDFEGLAAGVYHYAPQSQALDVLRQGDYRARLDVHAAVALVATGTYWRNAWKYQARTYRHFGWDNGTVTANLLATAVGMELPYRLQVGFVDDAVGLVLGLDMHREVALSLVTLGGPQSAPPSPACPPLDLPVEPLSARGDVDYPLMREMHAASSFATADEVKQWRQPRDTSDAWSIAGLDDVIARRGSTRHFDRSRSIGLSQLTSLLQAGTAPVAADFPVLNNVYVIANAVDGLASGVYVFEDGTLKVVKTGDFRAEAGFLDLGQDLAADAALNVYFMANIESVVSRLGDRGYRALQLEAGLMGGRMYLQAYALGFGATGLTFFDEAVTAFLGTDQSPVFLMAFGHKA
jgi:SagB-type dehydrogenase family enzyme